jgi:hypothetical protein
VQDGQVPANTYPRWEYFPRNVRPPEWVEPFVAEVRAIETRISTVDQGTGLHSDDLLRELAPGLRNLGYAVESSRSEVNRIRRPVLYGSNGRAEVAYDIDAFHDDHGIVVEVEAGRAASNNATYRDIIRASLILDAQYLVLQSEMKPADLDLPLDEQVEVVGEQYYPKEIRKLFRECSLPITSAGSTLEDEVCYLVPEPWNPHRLECRSCHGPQLSRRPPACCACEAVPPATHRLRPAAATSVRGCPRVEPAGVGHDGPSTRDHSRAGGCHPVSRHRCARLAISDAPGKHRANCQARRLGLKAGSCAWVSLTSADASCMLPDQPLRSRRFSSLPGRSRSDVPPMCPGQEEYCSPERGGRYVSPVGTPWEEIVPDGIGAFGGLVAGLAAWLSQRASSRSIDVSQNVADIERDRRSAERVPKLSARLDSLGKVGH